MAKILITGASGFLGWNLARALRGKHEVRGTYCRNFVPVEGCRMNRVDIASEKEISDLVERTSPDAVVHTVAMIDVDLCEREKEWARVVNEEGARKVARAAAEIGARLIYFSTDMVFDGGKGMYTEKDRPRPINHYGETKLAGERWSREYCPDAVILRVSLIYGRGNGVHESFLGRMLARLRDGEPFPVFTDQYRTPTYVGDICAAVEAALGKGDVKGIFHVSGPERLSRHRMGEIIAGVFGIPPERLRPVKMSDMEGFLPRPPDISLDNAKAARELGIGFTPFEAGVRAAKREFDENERS